MHEFSKNNPSSEILRLTTWLPNNPFPLFIDFFDVHKPVALHWHEFMELVIVSRGRGIHFTNEEEYPIAAGDVFAITGDIAHGYKDVDDLQVVNVLFEPAWFSVLTSPARKSMGFHALFTLEPKFRKLHRFENKLHLHKSELREVLELVKRIIEELAEKKTLHEMIVQTLFLHLVALLSRFYDRQELPPSDAIMKVGRCLSLMENEYTQPLQLATLAKAVHLSPRSLLRTFKKIMGVSPIDYLIRLRIEKSRELLRDPQFSITQVAFRVGFSDSNYFARQFKKVTGMNPRDMKSAIPIYS